MSPAAVADIGTCSTKVLTGKLEEGVVSLSGVGKSKSQGVKNGRVVKPDLAGKSLREAVERAEEMASKRITSIHIGIGGDRLGFSTNDATVTINSDDGIVSPSDVTRLKDLVGSIEIGVNERIISTIPRGFTLDGQPGVTNPVGLQGRRLDMVATLVTVSEKCVSNMKETTSSAGFELKGLLPAPQCTGELLLTEEEMNRGKMLIDFGVDTTELFVFKEGAIRDHFTLSLGGRNLTGDLSAKFNISTEKARKIKHKFDLSGSKDWRGSSSQVKGDPRETSSRDNEEIYSTLSARIQEIFELILSRARENGDDQLLEYGVKITGGSSRLTGLMGFLNQSFTENFKQAAPVRNIIGIRDVVKDPSYGPALGLLNCTTREKGEDGEPTYQSSPQFDLFTWIRKKIRTFLP